MTCINIESGLCVKDSAKCKPSHFFIIFPELYGIIKMMMSKSYLVIS